MRWTLPSRVRTDTARVPTFVTSPAASVASMTIVSPGLTERSHSSTIPDTKLETTFWRPNPRPTPSVPEKIDSAAVSIPARSMATNSATTASAIVVSFSTSSCSDASRSVRDRITARATRASTLTAAYRTRAPCGSHDHGGSRHRPGPEDTHHEVVRGCSRGESDREVEEQLLSTAADPPRPRRPTGRSPPTTDRALSPCVRCPADARGVRERSCPRPRRATHESTATRSSRQRRRQPADRDHLGAAHPRFGGDTLDGRPRSTRSRSGAALREVAVRIAREAVTRSP